MKIEPEDFTIHYDDDRGTFVKYDAIVKKHLAEALSESKEFEERIQQTVDQLLDEILHGK